MTPRPAGLRAVVGGTLLGAGAYCAPGLLTVGPLRARLTPRLAGFGDPGHVALTFDDGPDPASTPRFAELLAAEGVQATFFVLGALLERERRLGGELVAAGHELAVHGYDHRSLLLRGPRGTVHDVRRTRDLVAEVTGSLPRFFRPPYGALSVPALVAARRLGLQTVLWSGWGEDWDQRATARTVVDSLAPDLRGGATLLLHDSDCTSAPGSWRSALGALPELLARCRGLGLRVGPLREHGLPTPAWLPPPTPARAWRRPVSQPAVSQPAVSQPAVSQPAVSQPAVSQPAPPQPAPPQPAPPQPSVAGT